MSWEYVSGWFEAKVELGILEQDARNVKSEIKRNEKEIESLEQRLVRTNEMVADMKSLFEDTGAVSRDELYRLELL